MQFQSITKQTLSAQIATLIRTAILSGNINPGDAVIESALALRFGVSRGPLREAMRQLIEEGLLVSVPYTGTRVIEISVEECDDIYSMRTCLERFAFEHVWNRRNAEFKAQMTARHAQLQKTIDAQDDVASIEAELNLHSLVYEWCDNKILLRTWNGIRGRLQLYWAAHHRAHSMRGPHWASHDQYVELACGDDLDAMRAEIDTHMRRGFDRTKAFLMARSAVAAAGN